MQPLGPTKQFLRTLKGAVVSCALSGSIGCRPPSTTTAPAKTQPGTAYTAGVSLQAVTWDAATNRIACSKTGTSIQVVSGSGTNVLNRSESEVAARLITLDDGIVLVRAKDGSFEVNDFLADLFDGHRFLTGNFVSTVDVASLTTSPGNRASARYSVASVEGTPQIFLLEYAVAQRNGASCRIAIFGAENPKPILRVMATLQDSRWLDPLTPAKERDHQFLQLILDVGAYTLTNIPH